MKTDFRQLAWEAWERKEYRIAINYAKQGMNAEISEPYKVQLYDLLIKAHIELDDWKRAKEYCLEELNAFANCCYSKVIDLKRVLYKGRRRSQTQRHKKLSNSPYQLRVRRLTVRGN
jgi:hypothetical protein